MSVSIERSRIFLVALGTAQGRVQVKLCLTHRKHEQPTVCASKHISIEQPCHTPLQPLLVTPRKISHKCSYIGCITNTRRQPPLFRHQCPLKLTHLIPLCVSVRADDNNFTINKPQSRSLCCEGYLEALLFIFLPSNLYSFYLNGYLVK